MRRPKATSKPPESSMTMKHKGQPVGLGDSGGEVALEGFDVERGEDVAEISCVGVSFEKGRNPRRGS
jgi:hypothetical protein